MKIVDPVTAFQIFESAVKNYHILDNVDQSYVKSNYVEGTLEDELYRKCWIDTVQWHLEDIIRDEHIDPSFALFIKRRIDQLNQERTQKVESIDDYFLEAFKDVEYEKNARKNTESLAWSIDRLSVLCLKIYHMRIECHRSDASQEHKDKCDIKLNVLFRQKKFLLQAISDLMEEMRTGKAHAFVYRQIKMYNDSELNPILRQAGS